MKGDIMTTIDIQTKEWEEHPFTIDATIKIDDGATSTGYLHACRLAMLMEGYSNEVIRNACQELVYELEENIESCYSIMKHHKED